MNKYTFVALGLVLGLAIGVIVGQTLPTRRESLAARGAELEADLPTYLRGPFRACLLTEGIQEKLASFNSAAALERVRSNDNEAISLVMQEIRDKRETGGHTICLKEVAALESMVNEIRTIESVLGVHFNTPFKE